MEEDTCSVPECHEKAEFVIPRSWCLKHWRMWWEWPEERDHEAPSWFPEEV